MGIALLRLSTWDWCHHKGHSAVHWSCNSPMAKTSPLKAHLLACSGLSTTSHGLNDRSSILLHCHVTTAELSPSADEDYEMRLKAPEKLLSSISSVRLFVCFRQTTVSKDRNELAQCTSPACSLLMAWLPSCFRYCLWLWRRNTTNRGALAKLFKKNAVLLYKHIVYLSLATHFGNHHFELHSYQSLKDAEYSVQVWKHCLQCRFGP